MTYILTLKENSFNNRFSTNRVSSGMVFTSIKFFVAFCQKMENDTREDNENDVKSTILSPGAPGFIFISLDQIKRELWE